MTVYRKHLPRTMKNIIIKMVAKIIMAAPNSSPIMVYIVVIDSVEEGKKNR